MCHFGGEKAICSMQVVPETFRYRDKKQDTREYGLLAWLEIMEWHAKLNLRGLKSWLLQKTNESAISNFWKILLSKDQCYFVSSKMLLDKCWGIHLRKKYVRFTNWPRCLFQGGAINWCQTVFTLCKVLYVHSILTYHTNFIIK